MTGANGGRRDEQFRVLYQKYYVRVRRYFVRVFRVPDEDAEDLVQETFLRFYDAIDEYRGDAEWAFLETVARNVAFNRIRSRSTHKRKGQLVELDDPNVAYDPPAPAGPDFADLEDERLRRQRLYEAIAALSPGQRQCLQLWLQDYKYEDIARALRITLDAVKSRIRDAKNVLREKLGPDAVPEEKR